MKFKLVENINDYIDSLYKIKYYSGKELLENHSLSRDIKNNILNNLEDAGRIDIRNQQIKNFEDLATLCKIFRDTHTESFRVIFVKYNIIVGSRGIASKISDLVQIIPYHNDNDTLSRALIDYKNTVNRTGADHYYLVHNHPDGKINPSDEDFGVTNFFKQNIDGYNGHLILGKNAYNFIDKSGMMFKRKLDDTTYDTIEHVSLDPIDKVIDYINDIKNDAKNSIYILYINSKFEAIALEELSMKAFNDKNIWNYIINRKNDLGSSGVYLYTEDKELFYDKLNTALLPNCILDIILNDNSKIISKREISSPFYSKAQIEKIKRYNL